jgi:transposase
VLDVPPALSARVRLLDNARSDKTDAHDARSAAVVALRHSKLRTVGLEDHSALLRLLAKRHHDLVAHRTRAVCRLHTVLCLLVAGGLPKGLSAARAASELRRIRPTDQVGIERRRLAGELLAEVRRADADLIELKARIAVAVTASSTTVADVVGVGPIMAAYLIGYSGDVRRFPTAGHYARYNATAPIEASSGPNARHRLNPRGNRQLNHALHIVAVTQVRNNTPGRAYYLRKQAEGKTRKEAMRALKRRISDAVYRQLLTDTPR